MAEVQAVEPEVTDLGGLVPGGRASEYLVSSARTWVELVAGLGVRFRKAI